MGPLTTYGFVDQGWSLIISFAIGIAFGLVLEQSGFSSSRKLAGVFYGYDFVVLKVFFSAGITAMAGLVIMGYFGLIDLSAVYVNSNFLVSAVTGGVIMGFGFILGGFCPGTSVTGAMIGKIDAMVFVVGIFLGIFLFGTFFDTFKPLFSGYYFDGELLSTTLGLPKHLLVFLFILMALSAFAVGAYFEKKATKGLKPTNQAYSSYIPEILIVVLLAIVILFLPQNSSQSMSKNTEKQVLSQILAPESSISPDEFAHALINDMENLQIIDVRDEASFQQFHLPASKNIPLGSLADKSNEEIWKAENKKTVLVSNGGVEASKAQIIYFRMGYNQVRVLDGGINNLIETLFSTDSLTRETKDYSTVYTHRFRAKAAALFSSDSLASDIKIPSGSKPKPTLVTSKSAGGC